MYKYLGVLNRNGINDVYSKSIAGLLLFQDNENHYTSMPNKMFEYMAAGLPVVASDFEYWRNIIENNRCGFCVNYSDVEGIREAIEFLFNNLDDAKQMGLNGRKLIEEKYNWNNEEDKLLSLYSKLL